jgi:hypothetical protein
MDKERGFGEEIVWTLENVRPIWTDQAGNKYYRMEDIKTDHMENIVGYLHRREQELTKWAKEMKKECREKRKMFVFELKRRDKRC